jgi:hypothetical protein
MFSDYPSLLGCTKNPQIELLKAVRLFKERTVPVFKKVQTQATELKTVRSSLRDTEDCLASANKRIATLSQLVEALERVNEEATDLAEECKMRWENACEANQQLAPFLLEKDREIERHKVTIIDLKTKVCISSSHRPLCLMGTPRDQDQNSAWNH